MRLFDAVREEATAYDDVCKSEFRPVIGKTPFD